MRVVLTMAYPQSRDDFLGRAGGCGRGRDGWRLGREARPRGGAGRRHRRGAAPTTATGGREGASRLRSARAAALGIATRWSSWSTTSTWSPTLATPCCSSGRLPSSCTPTTSPIAFVVAASPGLFGSIRGAHEPLVRFFEPITLGPLDAAAAAQAISEAARRDRRHVRRRRRCRDRRAVGRAARTTCRSWPTSPSMPRRRTSRQGGVRGGLRAGLRVGEPGDLRCALVGDGAGRAAGRVRRRLGGRPLGRLARSRRRRAARDRAGGDAPGAPPAGRSRPHRSLGERPARPLRVRDRLFRRYLELQA